MNTYEDFIHYLKEHNDLINILKNNKLNIYQLFDKPIKVVEYFAAKAIDGVKLDIDEQEVYEIGYSYLNDCFTTLKDIYSNYLNNDLILLNKFDNVILYSILLNDLEGFLQADNLLTDNIKKDLNELNKYIEDIYIGKNKFDDNTITYINGFFETLIPNEKEFIPTYTVFIEIADGYRL